jgi:hypothetical protein
MTDLSPDELRELENRAAEVEALDKKALASDPPYADEELDAKASAKRSRLLLELESAELLPGSADGLRRLKGYPLIAGYANAAAALDRYLDSPGYKRLVKVPRVTRLLDSRISLDWFRVPTNYVPKGATADDWLALCDLHFRDNEYSRSGSFFARLEGKLHRLDYRTELSKPRLYRAELA